MIKKCVVCEAEFFCDQQRLHQKYCSPDCQSHARAKQAVSYRENRNGPRPTVMPCLVCGTQFKPRNSRHITCSSDCSRELNNRRTRERVVRKRPMDRTCKICGSPFRVSGKDTNRMTCSLECSHTMQRENKRAAERERLRSNHKLRERRNRECAERSRRRTAALRYIRELQESKAIILEPMT